MKGQSSSSHLGFKRRKAETDGEAASQGLIELVVQVEWGQGWGYRNVEREGNRVWRQLCSGKLAEVGPSQSLFPGSSPPRTRTLSTSSSAWEALSAAKDAWSPNICRSQPQPDHLKCRTSIIHNWKSRKYRAWRGPIVGVRTLNVSKMDII